MLFSSMNGEPPHLEELKEAFSFNQYFQQQPFSLCTWNQTGSSVSWKWSIRVFKTTEGKSCIPLFLYVSDAAQDIRFTNVPLFPSSWFSTASSNVQQESSRRAGFLWRSHIHNLWWGFQGWMPSSLPLSAQWHIHIQLSLNVRPLHTRCLCVCVCDIGFFQIYIRSTQDFTSMT